MNISKVLDKFEKQWGDGMVYNVATEPRPIEVISSGCLALDLATRVGGFPRNRITELWGPESGGKSTIAYVFMAEVARLGGSGIYLDVEQKVPEGYIKQCIAHHDVPLENIWVVKPPRGDAAMDLVLASIGRVDAIVIDSIADLVTPAEADASSSGDQFVGMLARFMSQNLKALLPKLAHRANKDGEKNTVLLGINQVREVIGSMYGPSETVPGGRNWRHSCSLRIKLQRSGSTIKDAGREVGVRVRARVYKNSVGTPNGAAEFDLLWGIGPDSAKDVFEVGKATGVIETRGSYSYFNYNPETGAGHRWQSTATAITFLRQNPLVAQEVRAAALEHVDEGPGTTDDEIPADESDE